MDQKIKRIRSKWKNRQRNDAVHRLKWGTILLSILFAYLHFLVSRGAEWPEAFYFMFVVIVYLTIDVGYSISKATSDRRFLRKKAPKMAEETIDTHLKARAQYGQYVGLSTVLFVFLVWVLVAFRLWGFGALNEWSFVAVEGTIAIIAASSAAKIVGLNVVRFIHNAVLFIFATSASVVYWLWISAEIFANGTPVPDDYALVYFAAVSSYAGHNMILASWFPKRTQRGHGDLIGWFSILYVIIILFLYSLNYFGIHIVSTLPWRALSGLFIITVILKVVSISLRDWVDEWRERREKNEKHATERYGEDSSKD